MVNIESPGDSIPSIHLFGQRSGADHHPHFRRIALGCLMILSAVVLAFGAATTPVAAAALPEYHLDKVFCANDPTFTGPGMIVIPKPVIYAMDYRPGVIDYQWVTWRVWLYEQVGSSWVAVSASKYPDLGQWQPRQKVHDRDTTQAYWFSANVSTFAINVTRGADYRVGVQVYWYRDGDGGTVPVAQYSPWTWASAHMNDSGWGWFQWSPDRCHYPKTTGVITL